MATPKKTAKKTTSKKATSKKTTSKKTPQFLARLELTTPLGNHITIPGPSKVALDDLRGALVLQIMCHNKPTPEATTAMTACLDALWPQWRAAQANGWSTQTPG
jgi:hypothetical protein